MVKLKILFVCSGNAHRSPLAEALLKNLRADIDVDSAGIDVAIPISEKIREYLAKQDADQYLKKDPEGLYSKQLSKYALIIAMEQIHKNYVISKCPECKNKIIVWNIKDPYFMSKEDAEKTYKQIEEKVAELAESL